MSSGTNLCVFRSQSNVGSLGWYYLKGVFAMSRAFLGVCTMAGCDGDGISMKEMLVNLGDNAAHGTSMPRHLSCTQGSRVVVMVGMVWGKVKFKRRGDECIWKCELDDPGRHCLSLSFCLASSLPTHTNKHRNTHSRGHTQSCKHTNTHWHIYTHIDPHAKWKNVLYLFKDDNSLHKIFFVKIILIFEFVLFLLF